MNTRKMLVGASILIAAYAGLYLYLKQPNTTMETKHSEVIHRQEHVDNNHDKPEQMQKDVSALEPKEAPGVTEKAELDENEKIIFLADIYLAFQLPESNIPEYVAGLLSNYNNDSFASTNMKLYRAFAYCDTAPKSKDKLTEKNEILREIFVDGWGR